MDPIHAMVNKCGSLARYEAYDLQNPYFGKKPALKS